jgi:hypothetical protein
MLSPNIHIHVSVGDSYILKISMPFLLQPDRQIDPGNGLNRKVRSGNKASKFNFWEYINCNFGTVRDNSLCTVVFLSICFRDRGARGREYCILPQRNIIRMLPFELPHPPPPPNTTVIIS